MKEVIVFCGDPHGHFYLPKKNEKVFILGDLFNHSAFNARKLKIITSFYPPYKKENYYFLAGNHDIHRTVEGTDIISCLGHYYSLNYPVFKNFSTALIPCFNNKFFIKVLCIPYYLPSKLEKKKVLEILLDPSLDIDIVAMHKTIDFEDTASFPFYIEELKTIMKENRKIKYIFLGHMHTPTAPSNVIDIDEDRKIIFAQSLIPTKYTERGNRFVFKVEVDENKNFSLKIEPFPTKKYIVVNEDNLATLKDIKEILEILKRETVKREKPKVLTEEEYPSFLKPTLVIKILNPEKEKEVKIKVEEYFSNYEVIIVNKYVEKLQEEITNKLLDLPLNKDNFLSLIQDEFLREILRCDVSEFQEKKNELENIIVKRIEELCLQK